MKITIIESPYKGDIERNVQYAKMCLKDSLLRGEAPFASHLLYTQALKDSIPEERLMGIQAGLEFQKLAELVAVYRDYGISAGMICGITKAKELGLPIEYRSIIERRCSQVNCWEKPIFEYTWPGKPLGYACKPHAERAAEIALAMGFNLQLNEITT